MNSKLDSFAKTIIAVFEHTTFWSSVRSYNHYTNNKSIVSGRQRKAFKPLHSRLNGSCQILLIRQIQQKIGKTRIAKKFNETNDTKSTSNQRVKDEEKDHYAILHSYCSIEEQIAVYQK